MDTRQSQLGLLGGVTSEPPVKPLHQEDLASDVNYDQFPASVSGQAGLKDRIRHHYELASEYYHSLWGEHIHHGYFLDPQDTKERAQIRLIELLLSRAELIIGCSVLDVGCGIGGTSRYLAQHYGCNVTGITISGKQVEIATDLTVKAAECANAPNGSGGPIKLGDGSVTFLELDAEILGERFPESGTFDCVWISEAMSHLPRKQLFFQNAASLLRSNGKLVIADWFKAEALTESQVDADIKPIEDGMLLPPLCTQDQYVKLAEEAGLTMFSEPLDISANVAKTW
ncbi:MAG: hypothetical protein Q9174_004565 [Haloplaca sp. 1 TL-2023]